jgi:hypothetical protein
MCTRVQAVQVTASNRLTISLVHGFDSSANAHTERGPWQRPPGSAKGLFLFYATVLGRLL